MMQTKLYVPWLVIILSVLVLLHLNLATHAKEEGFRELFKRSLDCASAERKVVKPRDKVRTPAEQEQIRACYRRRTAERRLIKKFYLVPRYSEECRDVSEGVMKIRNFEIFKAGTSLRYLEFPGCFDISSIVQVDSDAFVKKSWQKGKNPNIFANLKWEMTDGTGDPVASDFDEDFECQNEDHNGCGGYGNGCNYCDFCNGWQDRRLEKVSDPITCPTEPGIQSLNRKNLCVDNWDGIDKDGAFGFPDGEPDFFCYPENEPFVQLAEDLADGSFGTMKLQITLASNNTKLYKLTKRFSSKCGFKDWHERRMDEWRITETVACRVVVFDICRKKPQIVDGDIFCGA